jgi:ATP-dependent RNA helicase RhlE
VINFDIPNTPEDYVHRIGRTARAEATGDAFTLVDKDEEPLVKDIEQALKQTLPRVTLPQFDYKRPGGGGGGGGGRPHDHRHGGGGRRRRGHGGGQHGGGHGRSGH